MSTFVAGVQYDDFKGSVAADEADNNDLLDYLRQLGLAREGERLAGIRISSSSIWPEDVEDVAMVGYFYEASRFEERPLQVRAAECRISPSKLLSFYKRFDLVMVRRDMDLAGTKVLGPAY
ncbi:hypothetical protein [Sphingomonas sp. BK235]|uniref:hypothetical protein n=1 Tax=Sphingomonas sp. BK235 TaxID=2512131 RepID=UPI001050BEE7|nr:hypothetical protein [Sphingomonas sp. BK235]TCP30677.1 hypothetical protein EV292_11234 [Sphingomonas sp. BK235]